MIQCYPTVSRGGLFLAERAVASWFRFFGIFAINSLKLANYSILWEPGRVGCVRVISTLLLAWSKSIPDTIITYPSNIRSQEEVPRRDILTATCEQVSTTGASTPEWRVSDNSNKVCGLKLLQSIARRPPDRRWVPPTVSQCFLSGKRDLAVRRNSTCINSSWIRAWNT